MAISDLTPEEQIAFATDFFRAKVEPKLTGDDRAKFVVVDLNTGDYEVDDYRVEAGMRLRDRRPGADTYTFLDGEPYIIYIGGSSITFDPPLADQFNDPPAQGPMDTEKNDLQPDEIAALGERIYREKIRPTLTESDIGKFVHIDVSSGAYEIDDDDVSGDIRLNNRVPGALCYGRRVGYSAAYFMGGHDEEPHL